MINRVLLYSVFLPAFWPATLAADSEVQALFDAVRHGNMAIVRAAIENGADVESADKYGNTLLMHAAVFGKTGDLEFLLAHGADVNAANLAGHTPLMRAIPVLAKTRLLVAHGANIKAVTADGATVLMMAARVRTAGELVRYLIAKGADLEATNNAGLDAIMLAAEQGASANLKILLDAGASGRNRASGAPVISSKRSTLLDASTRDLVRRRAQDVTALMNAARADCEACMRLLLKHGADARAKTQAGLTALHGASYQGNPATVKTLLESGVPVNVADDRGFTPLMMAVNSRTKNTEVVRMLLDHGADPEAWDASGSNVAEWAGIGARRSIITMLPTPTVADALRTTATEPSARSSTPVRAAVEKSVALLQESGPKFFPKSGCISCYSVSIPMMALHEARRRGYATQAASEQMAKQTAAWLGPLRDSLLSSYCIVPAIATTASYALISLHHAGYVPDLLTDSMVRCLMVEQFPNGQWGHGRGERPPLSPESGIPGTALSARAVQLYAPPAFRR